MYTLMVIDDDESIGNMEQELLEREGYQVGLDEAITCWKYKKSLQGHNRYEKSDLVVLD